MYHLYFIISLVTSAAGQLINLFHAYDCSVPTNLQDFGFSAAQWCAHEIAKNVEYHNKTYQILQGEYNHRAKGFVCRRTQTRRVRHCGYSDWETTLDELGYTSLPKPLAPNACAELWYSGTYYQTETNQLVSCNQNTVCHFNYHYKGRSYIWVGGITNAAQVSCDGETTYFGNQKLDNAIIFYEDIVIHEEVDIIYGPQGVYVKGRDLDEKIPCPITANGCKTAFFTVGWTYQPDKCTIHALRDPVKGQEVINDKGKIVFMSSDGSLIRLEKKTSVGVCNKIAYNTDHDDFYLYDVTDQPTTSYFPQTLHVGEMLLATFVKIQDAAIYNLLKREIQQEHNFVVQSNCKLQYENAKKTFWHQHRDPGLVTWILGDSTFATTAGSVLYHYECDPVKVRARSEDRCYNALPVEIVAYSTKVNDSQGRLEGPLFMEPLTHRLVTSAAEIPCSRQMPSKYPTEAGTWIMATPDILEAKPPSEPRKDGQPFFETGLPDIDWSQAGIYSEKDLRDMHRYLEFGRTKDALVATVATVLEPRYQIGSKSAWSPTGPYHGFRSWIYGMINPLWDFFRFWGNIASVFLSFYMIWRIIIKAASWTYAFLTLRKVHGCSRMLLWIPCTTAFLLRTYQNVYQDRTPNTSAPPVSSTEKRKNIYEEPADRPKNKKRKGSSGIVPSAPPYAPTSEVPTEALEALYAGVKRMEARATPSRGRI